MQHQARSYYVWLYSNKLAHSLEIYDPEVFQTKQMPLPIDLRSPHKEYFHEALRAYDIYIAEKATTDTFLLAYTRKDNLDVWDKMILPQYIVSQELKPKSEIGNGK